jgi:hypothetical protein
MAQIMSEVLGKPVRFQQIPGKALKDRLTGFGMSEAMAQGTVDMAGFGVWGTLHGSLEARSKRGGGAFADSRQRCLAGWHRNSHGSAARTASWRAGRRRRASRDLPDAGQRMDGAVI